MNNKLKTGILIFIFAVLAMPMVQMFSSVIHSGPLNGEYTLAPDDTFTWAGWFDGSYAENKSNYFNDNVGLRPDLIRLNNEVDFDLFKKIHSEWRLLGDNACIFQDVYIYSYLGRDYDGYAYIQEKVRKMKAIQDTLGKLGKSFIFVHSPCKAFYYPEFFPSEFKNAVRGRNNFETYKHLADSAGINQVDFNSWFCAMKSKSTELLYPKQGFHWSVYGAMLGADSLVKYIEQLRHIHMPHPTRTNIVHTHIARDKDDDIAKTMNLIFPLAHETFSYPDVYYTADKTATKPSIIYIGDSFLFQWMNQGFMDNTNTNWQIWYYNQQLINKEFSQEAKHMLGDYDITSQIDKADCIIMMYTSRNLSKLGKDFVERTYAHYFPAK